jgi:hypothetical protein
MSGSDPPEAQAEIRALHKTVIDILALKVLLVCGPLSKAIMLSGNILGSHTLSLRGYEFPMYGLAAGGNVGKRLCIECPSLPAYDWSADLDQACKMSELFKFVTSVIKTKGILSYSLWPHLL